MNSKLSEELEVKVGIHHVTFSWFALVVDVVTEFARDGGLSELLYADHLALMSEAIKGLMDKFLKWNDAFERKGLRVNLGKTKVMVRSSITKDGLSKS